MDFEEAIICLTYDSDALKSEQLKLEQREGRVVTTAPS